MKTWLIEKTNENRELLKTLLDKTNDAIIDLNLPKNFKIDVNFSQRDWLSGNVNLTVRPSKKNKTEVHHVSIYDSLSEFRSAALELDQEIGSDGDECEKLEQEILYRLRSKGVFTSSWFLILASCRVYDMCISFSKGKYLIRDDDVADIKDALYFKKSMNLNE